MSKTPTPEQSHIVQAPLRDDVVVVAGAGSGKTYTMTERIIYLINHGVRPQQILGLTFTNKAAAELLSRVSMAVAANRKDMSVPSFLQPDVMTYDAFFQGIIRQYGLLVGFDQTMQPVSDVAAMQIIADVVEDSRDLILENAQLFSTKTGELQDFLTIVHDVYTLSTNIANAMIGEGCDTMEAAIQKIRAWDDAWVTQLDRVIGERKFVDDSEFEAEHGKAPSKPRGKNAKDPGKQDEYRQAAHEYQALKAAQRAINHLFEMRDATARRNLLLEFVEAYQNEKKRRHVAEFSDFTVAAFQLVSRFPSIGERYRSRYTHVLLDEYQDTSTTQANLLTKLFHISDKERSALSAVGDPFQSIYGWRGASAGAFRMLQRSLDLPATQEPYAMTHTRRNLPTVLQAANNLTVQLRRAPGKISSAAVQEVDVQQLKPVNTAASGTVGVLGYETAGEQVDGVVRFVKQALAAYHDRVERGKEEPVSGAPVAILGRGNKELAVFLDALREAGIPARIYGYSALLDMPEVVDTLALLSVVAFHTDSNPLMRLLATPRFGLSSKDLRALAELAEHVNTDYRYRALVQAGLVPAGVEGYQTRAKLVRQYRDRVANAVFLVDVLMRDDVEALLHDQSELSERGQRAVLQVAAMIRRVQESMYGSVANTVRTAAQALELDIDTVVAASLRSRSHVNPSVARGAVEGLVELVTTYTNELPPDLRPTLRGFLVWVRSLGHASVSMDDGGAGDIAYADETPEVELMTIHKAKGLQWEAVAIVNLKRDKFPSSSATSGTLSINRMTRRGENHLVDAEDPATGETREYYEKGDYAWVADASEATVPGPDADWDAPDYDVNAPSWLDDSTSVPNPVRVDSAILPAFPARADSDDAIEALDAMKSASLIDAEVSNVLGPFRDVLGTDEFAAELQKHFYMTQEQETGRTKLAEERRLMYVALTRAKYEALLTFAQESNLDAEPEPTESYLRDGNGKDHIGAFSSLFWMETFESMRYENQPRAWTPTNIREAQDAQRTTPASLGWKLPVGYFIGDDAQTFMNRVVGDAWNAPATTREHDSTLPWPFNLEQRIEQALARSADHARQARRKAEETAPAVPAANAKRNSLLHRAQELLADADLTSAVAQDLDESVYRRAISALRNQRFKVTSLQQMDKDQREYFRSIVRPVPSISSPQALAGTRLHAWAERFLLAGPDTGVTREELMANIGHEQSSGDKRADQRYEQWQRRLVDSRWARRTVVSAERSIVMALPLEEIAADATEEERRALQGLNEIVPGKLDAVFAGGLDESDETKLFTIVDWKTGRKPTEEADIAEKLRQLDLYRLLLASIEHVDLERIDATLYYLSEAQAPRREIHALPKSRAQILRELRQWIPQPSDND